MIQQCLKFTLWSLLNPICIFVSFYFTNYLGMYYTVSTNVISFSKEFFSVYVFMGMIALLAQIIFAYAVSRTISPQATPAKVLEVFLFAQYPFIVMIFIVPSLLSDIEGNIIGFIYFPIILLLSAISGVFSLFIYFKKIARIIEREESPNSGIKGVGCALVVVLIISLSSIYRFGSNTHLVSYMGWRTDIPHYAVSQTIKALKNRNPDAFTQYVDIDSFLQSTDATEKALLKAEILNAVEQGRFLTSDGERIRIGEWVMAEQKAKRGVGTFTQVPVVDSFTFSNKGNLPKATANFYSDVIGDNMSVSFELQERNGKYKISSGADFNVLVDKIKKHRKALEEFPYLANKDVIQSTLTVNLLDFSASLPEGGSLENFYWVKWEGQMKSTFPSLFVNISAEVGNNTNKRLSQIVIAVVYRDKQTNQVLAVDNVVGFIDKEPMKPQETRHVIFKSSVNPILAVAVKSGKAKVAEVYPAKASYNDGQTLELLKVQIPKL